MNWVQISKRGRLSPFPNYLSMESITSIMKQFTGYSYEKVLMIMQEGMTRVFLEEKDKERVEKLALERAKQDPLIIKRMTKEVEYLGNELIKFVSKVFGYELEKLSNQELFNFYKKYCEDYKQIYARYFTILSMENSLLQYLKEYLISKHIDEEMVSHYLSALTTSTKAMFPKEEEKELLKIALLDLPEEELNKRIKEHRDKYFWLPADYEDPFWKEEDFRERLDEIIKKGKIKEKLEEIEKFYKNKKEEVKKIQELLKIDDFHARLFELMRDGIYLKELRKKIVSESLYYVDGLLIEIGKRTNNLLKQMKHFLPEEIEEMLLHGMYHQFFARLRVELNVCLIENGKTKIYEDGDAENIKNKVIQKPVTVSEFKGLAVSPGKIQGRVKIVYDPKDIGKVEPGDIMVTVQAVPSFTPAIKIAGALVADGGTGITSHPATLAREAGIPCVTGVKIATEFLVDNEMVEVDGDKGIVRRLFK